MCDARRRGSVGGSGANVTALMLVLLALRESVAERRIPVGFDDDDQAAGAVSVSDVRVEDGAVLLGGMGESRPVVLSGTECVESEQGVSGQSTWTTSKIIRSAESQGVWCGGFKLVVTDVAMGVRSPEPEEEAS